MAYVDAFDDRVFALLALTHNFVFDFLFERLSDPWSAVVLLAPAALWIRKRKWQAIRVLLTIGVTLAVSDAVTEFVIKASLPRERPDGHGHYSFPSSHATNIAAAATILALEVPPAAPFAIAGAALVGFSRVYLVRHHATDVLAGFTLGALFGLVAQRILRRLTRPRPADATGPPPVGLQS